MKNFKILIVIITLLFWIILPTYIVSFVDHDGKVLKTETVKWLNDATPPEEPTREDYSFVGWNGNYTFVNNDETVVAEYCTDKESSTKKEESTTKPESTTIKETTTKPESTTEKETTTKLESTTKKETSTSFECTTKKQTTNPTITVSNVSAKAGDKINVDIVISNNPGIAGAILKLSYNSNLKLIKATNGAAFSPLSYTNPGSFSNPCKFSWDSESGMSTSNGTIVTLTFTVDDDVKSGDKLAINCSYNKGDIYDENLKDISLDIVSGYVIVK